MTSPNSCTFAVYIVTIIYLMNRLDHWLMSNTSFGPPLSSLDPSQVVYSQANAFAFAPEYTGQGDVWVDPSVPGIVPNSGLGVTFQPQNVGFVPAPMGDFMPSQEVPGMEGQWGDGNSVQYWNNLVDRKCLFDSVARKG
jgi:hypothetical protein